MEVETGCMGCLVNQAQSTMLAQSGDTHGPTENFAARSCRFGMPIANVGCFKTSDGRSPGELSTGK